MTTNGAVRRGLNIAAARRICFTVTTLDAIKAIPMAIDKAPPPNTIHNGFSRDCDGTAFSTARRNIAFPLILMSVQTADPMATPKRATSASDRMRLLNRDEAPSSAELNRRHESINRHNRCLIENFLLNIVLFYLYIFFRTNGILQPPLAFHSS
jgi:hypothetical protein